MSIATALANRLASAGARVAVSPPAAHARLKLRGVDPSACGGRLDCVSELGRAFDDAMVVSVQFARAGSAIVVDLAAVPPGGASAVAQGNVLLPDGGSLAALDGAAVDFAAGLRQAAIAAPREKPEAPEPRPAEVKSPEPATGVTAAPLPQPGRVALVLRFGASAFSVEAGQSDLFSLAATLEVDARLWRGLTALLDVDLSLSFGNRLDVALNPGSLGLKWVFDGPHEIRPYAGIGFGVFGLFRGEPAPWATALTAIAGVAYYPWPWLGLGVQVRARLQTRDPPTFGFLADLGIAFHL